MILLLIASTILLFGSLLIMVYGADRQSYIAVLFGYAGALVAVIALIIYCSMGWYYIAASHKARVLNENLGTNYTREDVFWAGDIIDEIREIKRTRIELNGNLITGEESE